MEFKIIDAPIPLSNTSNQQSGPEDNSLEDESEVADALIALSVSKKSLKDDMETKSDTERDSENVKIAQVGRKRPSKVQYSSASGKELKMASGSVSRNVSICSSSARSCNDSMQSKAEEAILAVLTLAKFSGGCYCEAKIRQVLGDTPDTSKALRKLEKDGKVKRSGKGGRLQPFTCSIPHSRNHRRPAQRRRSRPASHAVTQTPDLYRTVPLFALRTEISSSQPAQPAASHRRSVTLPTQEERKRPPVHRLLSQHLTPFPAFAVIAASPLQIDLSCVLEHVIAELTAFLLKANRALRQATLGTLNSLIVAYGDKIGPSAYEVIIVELSSLISDSDLHMTALALELCCTLMADRMSSPNVGLAVRNKVLPQALTLIKSSLLQGQALLALQSFFAALVYSANTSFDVLLDSLLSSAKPSPQSGGVAKQALYSIAQCVAVLCLAAGDQKCSSTVEMLTEILKDDSSTNSYLINNHYWQHGAPIFVYTGNEGDIEWFAANTGFLLDIAPKFRALFSFIEERGSVANVAVEGEGSPMVVTMNRFLEILI
uniref:HTH three-helical bundle domain-containing protein n=1 Tax=Fagus sylvatica TaxID=28930 RepID=A0A2N9FPE5_FAGSY